MWIIGCDYHPRFQQIAFVNTQGECGNRRLEQRGEAQQFYRSLPGEAVRIGMEASGHARWFEHLLAELGYELWIGDLATIRAAAVRKQKSNARDAEHLLQLLEEGGSSACASGCRQPRSAMCGSWCCIGIGWWQCARA